MPTVDIFYVSYAKDLEWFRHSLATVQANLSGYRNIIVVCPKSDAFLFQEVDDAIEVNGVDDWPGQGYFWQQCCKMRADTFTDADIIAHIDSDVFIKSPCRISDFFVGDRPAWLFAWYNEMPDLPWREPTERALATECPREFMQGFPFLIHRSTYFAARQAIIETWGMSPEAYIQSCFLPDHGPGFSEFNVLGHVAYTQENNAYAFIDRNSDVWPQGFHHTRQFWSHAPLADHLPEIQQMLSGGKAHHPVVTNRGWWVLSNDTHISKWVEQSNRLDFDVPLLEKICQHISPGDVVIDVGAFIGDHTLAYARATHGVHGGRVLAFEPNPVAFCCLEKNMAPLEHVECHNVALSDREETLGLAVDPNAGASHLTPGKGVKTLPLDHYMLDRVKLLKIDAEGFELRILVGAQETLRRCRPLLFLEVNSGALARQNTSEADLLAWIEQAGYRIEGRQPGSPQYDILCRPMP